MSTTVMVIAIIAALTTAAASAADTPSATDAAAGPDVRCVIIHKPGPAWVTGVDFRKQPGVMDHIAHYSGLLESGRMEMGGPFLDGSGGMMIAARGETEEAMKALAAEDPAVKSGLLVFEVKRWLIAMRKDDEPLPDRTKARAK